MINAKEAKRKSILCGIAKNLMLDAEKQINKAIEKGKLEVDIQYGEGNAELIQTVIMPELKSLGYFVAFRAAEPIPPGCPSDQWMDWDVLHISWEEAK